MRSTTVAIAGLTALVLIALVGIVAASPLSTQASTDAPSTTSQSQVQSAPSLDVSAALEIGAPGGLRELQATEGEENSAKVITKPYIGVRVMQAGGGVVVTDVLEDGPSASLLEPGDLITSVDGTQVASITDLTDAIGEAGSGALIDLTVMRGAQTLSVSVTVGEREVEGGKTWRVIKGLGPAVDKGPLGLLRDLDGRFVSGQIVMEDDSGSFKTHRVVVGTVSNVDVDAGTFTLTPKDNSDPIDYTVGDETKVITSHHGNLGGLNSQDPTTVMDINGEVMLVHQGEDLMSDIFGATWKGGFPGSFASPFGVPGTFKMFSSREGSDVPQLLEEVLEGLMSGRAEGIFEMIPAELIEELIEGRTREGPREPIYGPPLPPVNSGTPGL